MPFSSLSILDGILQLLPDMRLLPRNPRWEPKGGKMGRIEVFFKRTVRVARRYDLLRNLNHRIEQYSGYS